MTNKQLNHYYLAVVQLTATTTCWGRRLMAGASFF